MTVENIAQHYWGPPWTTDLIDLAHPSRTGQLFCVLDADVSTRIIQLNSACQLKYFLKSA